MAANEAALSLETVDELHDLLEELDNAESPISHNTNPSEVSDLVSDDAPKSNRFQLLLQTVDQLCYRLKDENDALTNDNQSLRSNILVLIEENNHLHDELRSTFVSDMLRVLPKEEQEQSTDKKTEVDIYTSKIRSLEIELNDIKGKFKQYETSLHEPIDLNYCSKCGAFLSSGQAGRERHAKFADLITENETNKHKLQQIQAKLEQSVAKEQEVLAKLRTSLAISEQNEIEKAGAIVERDQLQLQLDETQKRLNKFIQQMDEKVLHEKQDLEKEFEKHLKENAEHLKQVEEKCGQYELMIDRLTREKTSLVTDLELYKERMQRQEFDLCQITDSVKLKIQQAIRERDQAYSSAMQIRSDFEKLLLHSNQDLLTLRQQLGSAQNRLNDMENELLNSKKECLDLIEEINRITRENMMLKSAKQSLEESRPNNMDAMTTILNKREQDYHVAIENLEIERHQSLSHLENLVSDQSLLLNKLRSYSRQLTHDIERILQRKTSTIQDITTENQELRIKLSNAYERLEEMDAQLLEHNDKHVKFKQRMIDLNNQVKRYENMFDTLKVQN